MNQGFLIKTKLLSVRIKKKVLVPVRAVASYEVVVVVDE